MFSRRRVATAPKSISAWPFVGMSLMAADFFLYAASGLVAPAWAVAALLVVWLRALRALLSLVDAAPEAAGVRGGRRDGVLVLRADRRRRVARLGRLSLG